MSGVTFCLSHVKCCMSPVTNATATATYPLPAKSPIMQSRLDRKDPKTQTKFITQKIMETTKKLNFQEVCQY